MNNPYIRKILTNLFLLVILFQFNVGPTKVSAYWGEGDGDCIAEHGITYQNATYLPNHSINIDGIPDEPDWQHKDVKNYFVPTASEFGTDNFFVCYSFLKFIYDDSNLYILASWNDTTPFAIMDMFTFCWDINCDNYSTAMFIAPDDMTTLNESQGVDCWKWSVFGHENQTYGLIQDLYYNTEWGFKTEETQQVYAAFTYRSDLNKYFLELRKPLIGDERDVNFKVGRTDYRYSIAIMDDMRNDFHAVSWTYELQFHDLKERVGPHSNQIPWDFGLFGIGVILGCIGIISNKISKKLKSSN